MDLMFGKKQKIKTDFSELGKIGNNYMDPNSQVNRRVFDSLTKQATDITAQQGMSNQASMAMGFNPFANQQNRDLSAQVIKQAGGGWNEWLSNASNIGANMIGQKAQLQFQKDSANAQIGQARQQAISKFFQPLVAQGINWAAPGLGSALGGLFNSGGV
jgi:hypothetical protein